MLNLVMIRRLMDSTTSALLLLLLFVVRATFTLWPQTTFMGHLFCIGSLAIAVIGIATNLKAKNQIPEGSVS